MLVVILIISIIIALLLPAIGAARESARSSSCRNNLRQFGIAMHAYADRTGYFCSGAFDWKRDGAVTEVGWVADLVNSGTPVGEMLCPSNPNKLSEKFNDLLGLVPTGLDSCIDRAGTQPKTLPDGSLVVNPCRQILGLYTGGSPLSAGDEARRLLVEQEILLKGYNANYSASWFLVRSSVSLDKEGNLTGPAGCPISNKERTSTGGPLRRALSDASTVPSTNIPLLGDAAPGDIKEAILSQNIGEHATGSRLVESFCDGPIDTTTMKPPVFPTGTVYGGPDGWWAGWNKTVQDYRDFGAIHNGSCNILFSDGSVRSFADSNEDGFLNNGFDPALFTGSGVIGFQDASVEIGADAIFSGWSLIQANKGNLDSQ